MYYQYHALQVLQVEESILATEEIAEQKIIETERLYIYQNEFHPGQAMYRRIENVTGVTVEEDGHHTVHTIEGDQYVGAGWIRIMHKVPEGKKE